MLECEKCRTPMVIDFEDYDVIIYKCPECGMSISITGRCLKR